MYQFAQPQLCQTPLRAAMFEEVFRIPLGRVKIQVRHVQWCCSAIPPKGEVFPLFWLVMNKTPNVQLQSFVNNFSLSITLRVISRGHSHFCTSQPKVLLPHFSHKNWVSIGNILLGIPCTQQIILVNNLATFASVKCVGSMSNESLSRADQLRQG